MPIAKRLPVGGIALPSGVGIGRVKVPVVTPVTAVQDPELKRTGCTSILMSGAKTNKVTGSLHGNNGDILCGAATDGLGVVLQPSFLVHELLRTQRLVRILEGWEADAFTIYAVYASRQFLTPKVRTFIDFLVERFGENPYWDHGIA